MRALGVGRVAVVVSGVMPVAASARCGPEAAKKVGKGEGEEDCRGTVVCKCGFKQRLLSIRRRNSTTTNNNRSKNKDSSNTTCLRGVTLISLISTSTSRSAVWARSSQGRVRRTLWTLYPFHILNNN